MGGSRPLSAPRIFVYGTLRRGGSAASLLRGARPLGAARFQGRLYDLGDYPGVVASEDPADVVHGDLFALPADEAEALLARLDRYEGPEYRRVQLRVERADGEHCEAWLYLYSPDPGGLHRIESGDYSLDPRS